MAGASRPSQRPDRGLKAGQDGLATNPRRMRNRALHDALRDFALEAAALLNDDQKAGAEIEFDVDEEARRRGPVLYRYRPLTDRFINQRWHRLRDLPGCSRAAAALGDG